MTDATPLELLRQWLGRQIAPAATQWLDDRLRLLAAENRDRDLYLAVSMVPRKIGKDDLILSDADMRRADQARKGWCPLGWSTDQAARIVLMLRAPGDDEQFAQRLDQLCTTADVGELIAFYRGLSLYPSQTLYVQRAAEGVRTNMKAVFEAVAHRNPYPSEQFDENTWNQMVLKAAFIGSTLHPIQGFEGRRNRRLAHMVCGYVHERWAAGRDFNPELWRCVAPFLDDSILRDLRRSLASSNPLESRAAGLALHESGEPEAGTILASRPELASDIEAGRVSWETVHTSQRQP